MLINPFLSVWTETLERWSCISLHLLCLLLEIFTNVCLSSSNANSLLWRWRSFLVATLLPSSILCPWHLTNEWVDNVHMRYVRCDIRLRVRSLTRSSFTRTHSLIMQYHNSQNLTTHESSTIDESMTMCVCTRVNERDVATSQKVNTYASSRTHTSAAAATCLAQCKSTRGDLIFVTLASVLDNGTFESILDYFSCDLDLVLDHSLLVFVPNFSHVTWHLPQPNTDSYA